MKYIATCAPSANVAPTIATVTDRARWMKGGQRDHRQRQCADLKESEQPCLAPVQTQIHQRADLKRHGRGADMRDAVADHDGGDQCEAVGLACHPVLPDRAVRQASHANFEQEIHLCIDMSSLSAQRAARTGGGD
ncbi:hypothetical protein [Sphingomonas sp. J315]|uniref:hypothetical protein n=1 Tax=Sphingomonas sp. J315 TaxID=2898433 RepID=UPI0021AD622E|nr:hypothetical protein [Sphingomonas sp. J315]UUX99093.1 hypothetical protein LRS08_16635 [Sphingomonas sp. J315]